MQDFPTPASDHNNDERSDEEMEIDEDPNHPRFALVGEQDDIPAAVIARFWAKARTRRIPATSAGDITGMALSDIDSKWDVREAWWYNNGRRSNTLHFELSNGRWKCSIGSEEGRSYRFEDCPLQRHPLYRTAGAPKLSLRAHSGRSEEISDAHRERFRGHDLCISIRDPRPLNLGQWPERLSARQGASREWPTGTIRASDINDLRLPTVVIQSKTDPSVWCRGVLEVTLDAVLSTPAPLSPPSHA